MEHSPFTYKLQEVYEAICTKYPMTGSILEIGCGPSEKTLLNMPMLSHAAYRVGVNLQAYNHYVDFNVIKCNANNMQAHFDDKLFDVVLCNVVFEHDPYFWKSLEEIRRVLKPGGIFILGVPALVDALNACEYVSEEHKKQIKNLNIINATLTYRVHNAPGDYWRFTEQAYKDVLMEGFKDIEYALFLMPPIIIGHGIRK